MVDAAISQCACQATDKKQTEGRCYCIKSPLFGGGSNVVIKCLLIVYSTSIALK